MVFVPANDGRWVNENYARLAEIIKDFNQALELRWIPPDRRSTEDKKPYMIIDLRNNQPVFFASELDTPEDILSRLFEGDNKKGDVLRKLEAREAARDALKLKEWVERLEEARDEAKFLLQSPLNYVKHNGKKLDDQRRTIE